MQKINLNLTIDEANLILEALGELPFSKVFQLIGKIQEQAGRQLNPENGQVEQDDGEIQSPMIGE